ncbi:hypothetical protein QYF61_011853 [Mycteria americana]|uniref:Uncharacterized protein n=1 Tax=Mycteria americana TaxID=33587 RepID=A0AAN7RYZ7_MYCAM|nr:hypothetical protein QYF61_011853 [Mycteria americana]
MRVVRHWNRLPREAGNIQGQVGWSFEQLDPVKEKREKREKRREEKRREEKRREEKRREEKRREEKRRVQLEGTYNDHLL